MSASARQPMECNCCHRTYWRNELERSGLGWYCRKCLAANLVPGVQKTGGNPIFPARKMKKFNLSDTEFSSEFNLDAELGHIETSEKYKNKVKRFLDKMNVRTATIKDQTMLLIYNALLDLRLPGPGEQLRIRTQQSINLIAIILKIIEHHGKIDELTIATYTLNRQALAILHDLLLNGNAAIINLLVASSYTFRDKKYYQHLKNTSKTLNMKGYDIHLTFAWSHFKITLARCGQNFYQFEGSMNYSENNMAEQLIFENNRETYEHDYNFINTIMRAQTNSALEIIC